MGRDAGRPRLTEPAPGMLSQGVAGQQDGVAITMMGPNGEGGAEDGPHTHLSARIGEPSSSVQPVAVGKGHRGHAEFGRP